MQPTQLLQKLGRNDFILMRRDRFAIYMLGFIVYIIAALRWGLPWANNFLAERGILPNDFTDAMFSDFYPPVIGFLAILLGSMLVGTVVGFIFLDEKDTQTLRTMLVSPIPFNQYVLYRMVVPVVLSFIIVIVMVMLINVALVPLWQLVLISAAGALGAPVTALFFAIAAENKVQGFAYAKFLGIGGWAVLGGYFVPEPYQFLLGIYPPYWVSKGYWMALEGSSFWWVALLIGVVLQLIVIRWMMGLFNKKVYAV